MKTKYQVLSKIVNFSAQFIKERGDLPCSYSNTIKAMQEYADQYNSELFIKWENQRQTIKNWQDVFNKHFDKYAHSDNLDECLTDLQEALIQNNSELVRLRDKVTEIEGYYEYECSCVEKLKSQLSEANERVKELEEFIKSIYENPLYDSALLIKCKELLTKQTK